MNECKRLEEAIASIQWQYLGIDYSKGKDMTAICLVGDQAEAVIKALSEYKELVKAKADGRLIDKEKIITYHQERIEYWKQFRKEYKDGSNSLNEACEIRIDTHNIAIAALKQIGGGQ